ncbi:MAG: ribonuclease III [Planctomycetia bacterium]|nr:ribonuclease III [Planctomycetia bacterium]
MNSQRQIKEQFLKECEDKLQYHFQNKQLLMRALTHSSSAITHNESNERLEFLGDSVLGFAITDLIYRLFPFNTEGELSKIKGAVVSRKNCYEIIKKSKLDNYLILGRGMKDLPNSLLANLMEAFIGAIYLDGGIENAKNFIERFFKESISAVTNEQAGINFKTNLQTLVHQLWPGIEIEYHLLDEQGPVHSRCFKVTARINNQIYPAAWGCNKKDAEQKAAENALSVLRGQAPPHITSD